MDFLRENWFQIAAGLTALCLLIFNIILSCRLRAYKKLTRLVQGGTVEEHIVALGERLGAQQRAISENRDAIADLRQQVSCFPHHWHLERYNAFENTGSDLSFSLALLNDMKDGFVLTGIFGREDTRIYAKPVNAGKSAYHLSEEEELAIKKAIKTNADHRERG
ncbi:MAG: DUF4446 family protein [Bacillota bacterium]|jgi:hypothetical protein|nr:DUF4446 family protein [Bacillota bacterium]HOC07146.1 DUF4446 family protein [Bacillota bacterium]HPZ22746.1 DUF4446 family protein [Bacillota bacterium]